ncbi:hypothetical protein [Caldisericum exile]|uniref:Uncharacterized protein n=1 Tax=Caldisericum exile (strain DSM 21853 / NBRC 104410 / AZM16c01) TaxID=511051 RepID=A0A7U6GFP4_CALEA|nr:hypothetical protein [Caldisericum exile]BAL81477.1 hypothetical protein CSE_13510 [Caldisericum exile AZM16c01]
MKEKINEYLDGKLRKEEIEPLLEDKEYASYYEDLKKMKEGLRELRIESPDFVSKLGLVEKRHAVFRYSLAFALVLVIVFGAVFSRNFILNRELVSKQTEITRQFKVAPNMDIMQKPIEDTIKIEIDNGNVNSLLEELKKIATLKSTDKNSRTYVFAVKGDKVSEFLNTIENTPTVKVVENTLKDKSIDTNLFYQITLVIQQE